MSIPSKILNYLKKKGVEVRVVGHKKVYTAYDLAQTLKEKLEKIGKALLVRADGKYAVVLVPGNYRLDLNKVKKALKAKKVELAGERHLKKLLDMKLGALHPFTGLSRMALLLDRALLRAKETIVGAGSLTESLRMKVKDLAELEKATLGDFGRAVIKQVKKAKSAVLADKKARKQKK